VYLACIVCACRLADIKIDSAVLYLQNFLYGFISDTLLAPYILPGV
jgi:hypothetical protein